MPKHITLITILLLLSACTSIATPTPVLTPTSTLTPSLTPSPANTPTPTAPPTPTPIPPLELRILWPDTVSALAPVSLEVDLIPPPGIEATAVISAIVLDAQNHAYYRALLRPDEEHHYRASSPLQLPLDPMPGAWQLLVRVDTKLNVTGSGVRAFTPAPLTFHTLTTETLPSGITLRVPAAFKETQALGDTWAGARVWQHTPRGYPTGEIAIWWAPGPTEALLYNTAIMMLEATHDAENPPGVESSEETTWQEHPAFLFQETWPGTEGGPALAWVIQGPDLWLYVLRIRTVGGNDVPAILQQIAETFTFVTP
ncbi:MAG: hypothetical protein JXA33_23700 [Anaerolineae bacterium]|nr:hypothetical protein [Anaerolineae bacterium]